MPPRAPRPKPVALLAVIAASVVWALAQTPATTSAPPPEAARPELVLQTGHAEDIGTITFSPDGRWLASGSWDTTVKIWEVATGLEVRTFAGHPQTVTELCFSADGRLLVSVDLDSSVRVWEVETGLARLTLEGISLHNLACSPDGRWLAGELGTGQVKVWEVETGRLAKTLEASVSYHVWFSPDGQWLGSLGVKGRVVFWQVGSWESLRTLDVPLFERGQRLSAAGSRVAGLKTDGSIAVWDLLSGEQLHTLKGQLESNALALSPDGHWLASGRIALASPGGGLLGTAKVWDLATGRELYSVIASRQESGIRLAFSPDGRLLAGTSGANVKLWETATGRELATLGSHSKGVEMVAFTADGRWLFGGPRHRVGDEFWLQVWDTATGYSSTRLPPGALYSPAQGHWLESKFLDDTVRFWDAGTGRVLDSLKGPPGMSAARSVALSPDGQRLAATLPNRMGIKVWEVPSWRELFTVGKPRERRMRETREEYDRTIEQFTFVSFSPDGRWLVGQRQGPRTVLWEALTGKEMLSLGESGPVAFNSEGTMMASAYGTIGHEPIRLREVPSGRLLATLGEQSDTAPRAVAFSPQGNLLASAHANSVRLWNPVSGRELKPLVGHSSFVSDVAFSPDGRSLASASHDGSVRLWDPQTGAELATLVLLRKPTEWLVVTPDGLFDGSPEGWQRIIWRFARNQTSSVDTFFSEFYYPGLLAEILAGKKPKAPRDIAQVDRRQPQVQLSLVGAQGERGPVGSRTVTVRVEATEAPADAQRTAGSGARDLRLFRNGSLVKVWRGDVLQGRGSSVTLEASVPIVAGENRFTAYAFNHDNIKSADASLIVTGAPSLERKGIAYILAIGINQYANPDYNLSYAVPDAQAFADELARQQVALGSFASVEVIPLLDAEATKANILRALARLAGTDTGPLPAASPLAKLKPAEPEDVVFVYYAGHGTAAGPRFYLIPHDLGYAGQRDALDEAALQTILAHSLSDLDLEQAFEKVDAGRLLLVIDACNSGQALEAEEKRRGPMNSKGLAQLAYEKGMYILTAAQGYQAALEVAQLGHGLLTYALVEEGLKTPAADVAPSDGQVVVREWLDFATLRVPQLQQGAMEAARQAGRDVVFVEGEQLIQELEKRSLQRPRVFYRREPESQPLIVARPPTN